MDITTPPLSPAPAKLSLSAEINAGTRSLHTQLNRLITTRLPLCLPPYTQDPTVYAHGLRHFAHVFLTFESLFADIAANFPASPSPPTSPPASPRLNNPSLGALLADPYSDNRSSRPRNEALQAALGSLLPTTLLRSGTLHTDLTALHNTSPVTLSVALSRFPSPAVQSFVDHIRTSVAKNPQVLVAYAWVFYMALFSGGRWIRAQLVNAGHDFWRNNEMDDEEEGGVRLTGDDDFEIEDEFDSEAATASSAPLEKRPLDEAGLSFLFFAGENDGEDIKAEFKSRLAAAETLFSQEEREDVVNEAKEIFRRCIELVRELDGIMGTPLDVLEAGTRKDMRAVENARMEHEKAHASNRGLGIMSTGEVKSSLDLRATPKRNAWISRSLLNTASSVGTAVVLSSAAWLALNYLKGAVAEDGWWATVAPLFP